MKKWKRILVVLLVALMLLASGSMAEEQVVVFDEGLPEIDFVGQGGEQADALDDVDLSELELADSEDYKTYSLQENDSFGAGEPFYDLYIGVKEKYAVKTNGLGEKLTFQSSDTSIVKVSKKGVLTGVNEGKAILTIFSNKREVRKHEINVLPVPNKVRLDQKSITIGVKETITVEPIIPEGTHASFTWSSKKKKIATVNQNGKIKGMKVGRTTITVKTHNGKKATITVNVLKAPDKIELDQTTVTMGEGDRITLKTSLPKGTSSQIRWTSSNGDVAYVSGGEVWAHGHGEAKITAKTFNGKKAVCTIRVLQRAMWIMDDLFITQLPGEGTHAGTFNFDIKGVDGNNILAPFDCTIVKTYPGELYGNTVVIQSLQEVLYANGSHGYMSMAFGHDNDISDCIEKENAGTVIAQGKAVCQNGDYGMADGVHTHVTVIQGKFSDLDAPQWIQVDTEGNIYTFRNAIHPVDALFVPYYTYKYHKYGIRELPFTILQ